MSAEAERPPAKRSQALLSCAYAVGLVAWGFVVLLLPRRPREYGLLGSPDTLIVHRGYYVIRDDRTGARRRYAGSPTFGGEA